MISNRAGSLTDRASCAMRRRITAGFGSLAVITLLSTPAHALQTFTLDFTTISLGDPTDEYVYSPAEQAEIKTILEFRLPQRSRRRTGWDQV